MEVGWLSTNLDDKELEKAVAIYLDEVRSYLDLYNKFYLLHDRDSIKAVRETFGAVGGVGSKKKISGIFKKDFIHNMLLGGSAKPKLPPEKKYERKVVKMTETEYILWRWKKIMRKIRQQKRKKK